MRSGYTLKAEGSTRHFFATYVRGDLQYVEDQNYAWFTESRDLATAMALDLALRANVSFEVVPYAHA